jgi:hypothetical protein
LRFFGIHKENLQESLIWSQKSLRIFVLELRICKNPEFNSNSFNEFRLLFPRQMLSCVPFIVPFMTSACRYTINFFFYIILFFYVSLPSYDVKKSKKNTSRGFPLKRLVFPLISFSDVSFLLIFLKKYSNWSPISFIQRVEGVAKSHRRDLRNCVIILDRAQHLLNDPDEIRPSVDNRLTGVKGSKVTSLDGASNGIYLMI